jgi:hypothetical protein
MQMKFSAVIFVVGLTAFLYCGDGSASTPPGKGCTIMPTQDQSKVDYREYLLRIGEKLNCYYTIERLGDTEEKPSPLAVAEVTDDDVETIDALVAKLNQELTGVTATRDETNRSVIHLNEDALQKVGGYDLSRKVTLNYKGDPYRMLGELNKLDATVGPQTSFAFPNLGADSTTPVNVNAQDQPLRQVLTFAVPLDGYNRIIWVAITSSSDNKIYTGVRYYGIKQVEPLEPE